MGSNLFEGQIEDAIFEYGFDFLGVDIFWEAIGSFELVAEGVLSFGFSGDGEVVLFE